MAESLRTFNNRLEKIAGLAPAERDMLERAYALAKEAHRGQWRLGEEAERYFEHPRAVFNILFDELGVRAAEVLAAALLHDVVEDSDERGEALELGQWLEQAAGQLAQQFSPAVAEMVLAVTKPPTPDGTTAEMRENVKREYWGQLAAASDGAILVKIADRLHNLRSMRRLVASDRFFVLRKLQETKEVYLPLFNQHTWEADWEAVGQRGISLATQELSELEMLLSGTR